MYVRLGYEFNIACRAFNAIGVETQDLGPVPDLLRGILEETLSQEASQASLDRFLPRIRDIIINLLHGLKRKQQRLRQRSGRDGGSSNGNIPRQGSLGSAGDVDEASSRQTARAQRHPSGDNHAFDGPELPPRTSSVTTSATAGRSSPNKHDSHISPKTFSNRVHAASRDTLSSSNSSMSSMTLQNIPVIAPYPSDDTMPMGGTSTGRDPVLAHPAPPPPPKQQDALAALQRGGDLERRASRRFSAYQIQKHLGASPHGIPMMPQNSPVPNRGRDVRESMNAVRTRSSQQLVSGHRSQRGESSPHRRQETVSRKPQESTLQSNKTPVIEPPPENVPPDSPTVKSPEEKIPGAFTDDNEAGAVVGATLTSPVNEPAVAESATARSESGLQPGTQEDNLRPKTPSPRHSNQFTPEESPQPGKELTLFLQYKTKIKKFVLADGYKDLSVARLQLAFIEKFAWNTHSNGIDLPEIYIQDPVSGVRHELEDLSDIKDRSVLVLNVEVLDEVKRHFDENLGKIHTVVESIQTAVMEQQSAIQRVSDRQQDTAKEIASIAAAPQLASSRVSTLASKSAAGSSTSLANKSLPDGSASQLDEVQSLRRDLAVMRQTYTSFVSDIEASMSGIRAKAASVKNVALKASVPTMDADTGRAYVNAGKKTLSEDSEKIVNRVDDLQDLVEDLRKDVVTRGVRPLPRQLETVAKDITIATAELKRLQDFLRREKPVWTKIWERELQVVCDDRDLLTMQEELAADLEDDLDKAGQTFALVEQATKQQHLQGGSSSASSATAVATVSLPGAAGLRSAARPYDPAVDPRKAKDDVLGAVRALRPNHEARAEAIERAERNRLRELESRGRGEFQKELGHFVEENKLKKTGGAEEAERVRMAKDERIRKEVWERMNGGPAAEAGQQGAEGKKADGAGTAVDESGAGAGAAPVVNGDVGTAM